ncbi:rho GDP-dissociation inhibitor 1 isoform X1 [Symphalangus syndactylus]|uniref:rho GDP-dissociation inhibitor 1 isoform X1 n=1 Tax=Symphalangus syndactylus TaxID=9590 RepID=UPI002442B9D5|nr:rho GDP-dissociation inhibitor 1 isoform X1 [Symphalangus syndactylus]XP_055097012.1 rho GDP-dissociation inhibitor 1 isoform X1 [Symphalangus syndactylus]
MAEQEPTAEQLAQIAAENEEDEHSVNYKPPAQKSIQEIQELDKDDESLRKYKEALLGRVAVSADPNVPNVVVTGLTLVCSSAPGPLELDLTGDLESFKKQSFVLKEGVEYRIKISFRVNREIVSGMKYIQHTYRKGVKIDKTDYMVGSYGPRAEEYEFLTPVEEAPKGFISPSHPRPGFRRERSSHSPGPVVAPGHVRLLLRGGAGVWDAGPCGGRAVLQPRCSLASPLVAVSPV